MVSKRDGDLSVWWMVTSSSPDGGPSKIYSQWRKKSGATDECVAQRKKHKNTSDDFFSVVPIVPERSSDVPI